MDPKCIVAGLIDYTVGSRGCNTGNWDEACFGVGNFGVGNRDRGTPAGTDAGAHIQCRCLADYYIWIVKGLSYWSGWASAQKKDGCFPSFQQQLIV